MPNSNTKSIGWLKATGTHFDIGVAMGRAGRKVVHDHLIRSEIWARITSDAHLETVQRLMKHSKAKFPEVHQELLGLAEGLDLPIAHVFAWNARGDLLASAPDGCTTILTPQPQIQIAHNEDGLPFFRGSCFMVAACPDGALGFTAFCYPGSIAGHSFGWNQAGIAQAVNNIRLTGLSPELPRMVLGRMVLGQSNLDDAVQILKQHANSGGFHMTLAQTGDPRLLSVEYGGGECAIVEIKSRTAHANHALQLQHRGQIVTASSKDRQQRAGALLDRAEAIDILRDKGGDGLPIHRTRADDPDDENTLATCIMDVSSRQIDWHVYSESTDALLYHGMQMLSQSA